MNQNILVLGVLTLLSIGGVALFLASTSGGNIFNTFQNTTNEITNNTYFTQLIADGGTTKEDLESIAEIRPYGDGFIGVSKTALTWEQAGKLAAQTGSEILTLDRAAVESVDEFLIWIVTTFKTHLSTSAWVNDRGTAGVLIGSEILAPKDLRAERKMLLHWHPRGTSAAIADNGWKSLFPNDSLAGWTGDVAGYRLANGILTSKNKGGDLISPKEYGSFQLKFDLRLSSGANNGIGVWCAKDKGTYKYVAYTGFEIQLIDDLSPTYTNAQSWHLHGALTRFISPTTNPMGAVGTWNTHEIRMEGTRLTVIINNITIIDQELPTGAPVSGGGWPRNRLDLTKKRGHLVFCGMKGPVDFRNVMIKELP